MPDVMVSIIVAIAFQDRAVRDTCDGFTAQCSERNRIRRLERLNVTREGVIAATWLEPNIELRRDC